MSAGAYTKPCAILHAHTGVCFRYSCSNIKQLYVGLYTKICAAAGLMYVFYVKCCKLDLLSPVSLFS